MYIANQWNSTISMGYVVRRKHLSFFLDNLSTMRGHLCRYECHEQKES